MKCGSFMSLQVAYRNRDSIYKWTRKVLALPFLPAEHIPGAFTKLKEAASTPQNTALMDYVDSTWMKSTVWPPSSWSIFMCSTRTNNDVEGWHRRLNGKAGRGQLQLYLLVPLLHEEAQLVPLQMKLVSEKKLTRFHRKKYRTCQGKIFKLWGEYTEGTRSTTQLLRACSRFNGPSE